MIPRSSTCSRSTSPSDAPSAFDQTSFPSARLSAMTTLAPARIGGLMMGVWFLATSVGNFIAGRLAGFYESMPLPKLFTIIAAMGVTAGLLLLPLARPVTKMTGEAE